MFRDEKSIADQLVSAAYRNDLVFAEELLRNGAPVDCLGHFSGSSPLESAAWRNHLKMAELLLQYKADVNYHQGSGIALLCASHSGYLEMVRLLLKNGAKDFPTDRTNFTALYWAIIFDHSEIVTELVASGANVNSVRNLNGDTPLSSAIERRNLPVLVLLLEHGAIIHDFKEMHHFITNYDTLIKESEQAEFRSSHFGRHFDSSAHERIQQKWNKRKLPEEEKLHYLLIASNILYQQVQDNKEEMRLQNKPFEFSELEKEISHCMQKFNKIIDLYEGEIYLGINYHDEKTTYDKEKNKHVERREVANMITDYLFFTQSSKSSKPEEKIQLSMSKKFNMK